MTRIIGTAVAAALLVGAVGRAAAEEPAFEIGGGPVWFLLGGVAGGATFADQGGGTAGGELSLVRLDQGRFAGFYADAAYDFGAGATYLSAGPELGLHLRSVRFPISVGADGGAALRFGDETDLGATGRAFVALFGLFSLYGRYAYFGADDGAFQAGAMLKFPLTSPFGRGAID